MSTVYVTRAPVVTPAPTSSSNVGLTLAMVTAAGIGMYLLLRTPSAPPVAQPAPGPVEARPETPWRPLYIPTRSTWTPTPAPAPAPAPAPSPSPAPAPAPAPASTGSMLTTKQAFIMTIEAANAKQKEHEALRKAWKQKWEVKGKGMKTIDLMIASNKDWDQQAAALKAKYDKIVADIQARTKKEGKSKDSPLDKGTSWLNWT